jgi:hypothetical protein
MEEEEPIPLQYETPLPAAAPVLPPAPPDARRGCLTIAVVAGALAVALVVVFGELGVGLVAAACDLVAVVGIVAGIFAGIKYGTQKKDFWT